MLAYSAITTMINLFPDVLGMNRVYDDCFCFIIDVPHDVGILFIYSPSSKEM